MRRGSILNEAVAQVQLPQCGHPLDALESEGGKCGQPITHSFPSSFLGKSPWKTMAEEAVEVSREMLFRSNGPIQGQILAGAAAKMGIGGQFPLPSPPLYPRTCVSAPETSRTASVMTTGALRPPSQPALSRALGQQGPWHQEAILMF